MRPRVMCSCAEARREEPVSNSVHACTHLPLFDPTSSGPTQPAAVDVSASLARRSFCNHPVFLGPGRLALIPIKLSPFWATPAHHLPEAPAAHDQRLQLRWQRVDTVRLLSSGARNVLPGAARRAGMAILGGCLEGDWCQ